MWVGEEGLLLSLTHSPQVQAHQRARNKRGFPGELTLVNLNGRCLQSGATKRLTNREKPHRSPAMCVCMCVCPEGVSSVCVCVWYRCNVSLARSDPERAELRKAVSSRGKWRMGRKFIVTSWPLLLLGSHLLSIV